MGTAESAMFEADKTTGSDARNRVLRVDERYELTDTHGSVIYKWVKSPASLSTSA